MFCPIAHIAAAIEVDLVSDVCDDAASFRLGGRTKGHQVALQEIQQHVGLPASAAVTQWNHWERLLSYWRRADLMNYCETLT